MRATKWKRAMEWGMPAVSGTVAYVSVAHWQHPWWLGMSYGPVAALGWMMLVAHCWYWLCGGRHHGEPQ